MTLGELFGRVRSSVPAEPERAAKIEVRASEKVLGPFRSRMPNVAYAVAA